MSATTSTIDVRGYLSASNCIPYTKYFELFSQVLVPIGTSSRNYA
ncbi:7286_t:CDS:2, partial [Diversispora eburnea]